MEAQCLSQGQAQFVPGTYRCRRAAEKVHVLKAYVPLPLATISQVGVGLLNREPAHLTGVSVRPFRPDMS